MFHNAYYISNRIMIICFLLFYALSFPFVEHKHKQWVTNDYVIISDWNFSGSQKWILIYFILDIPSTIAYIMLFLSYIMFTYVRIIQYII